MAIVTTLILLCALVLVVAHVSRSRDDRLAEQAAAAFASTDETSAVDRALLALAKPMAGLGAVNLDEESPTYKTLRTKLAAADNMYSGSVVVFMSVQITTVFISAIVIVLTIASGLRGLPMAAAIIGAIAFVAYPYNRVYDIGRKRTEAVNANMPEFAELLLMPLSSGYGILPALSFTAERVHGPVGREVSQMLDAIRNRTSTEAEAFSDCADRLGTAAARSFFNSLAQAHLEGTSIVETIRSQAEQLRKADYEQAREKVKKLPNTLAVIMGLHLLPTLFLLMLFPMFYSLGSL